MFGSFTLLYERQRNFLRKKNCRNENVFFLAAGTLLELALPGRAVRLACQLVDLALDLRETLVAESHKALPFYEGLHHLVQTLRVVLHVADDFLQAGNRFFEGEFFRCCFSSPGTAGIFQ